MKSKRYLEDTAAYLDLQRKERILSELYFNAAHTIRNVYLFKHFDDFKPQLLSDKNEDKKEIYWNTTYFEKLIDYVKISIAFETFNKAVLIEKGYLIHTIKKDSKSNLDLYKKQQLGLPIELSEFIKGAGEIYDRSNDHYYLSGFKSSFDTIPYSTTLKESYQEIIGLDAELCSWLREINSKRNKLHFFTEFKGAYNPESFIQKWEYIKNKSFDIILEKQKTPK